MTEVRHTPGPWKACPSIEGDFLGVYPDTGEMEFPVAKMPEIVRSDINAANARLIAAAPDMLAVLKRVEVALTILGAKGQPLKSIRAAIAKAEAA